MEVYPALATVAAFARGDRAAADGRSMGVVRGGGDTRTTRKDLTSAVEKIFIGNIFACHL